MTSLAAQVEERTGAPTYVFGATEGADVFLGPKDAALCGEEELEEALGKLGWTKVVADPYYKDVLPADCELISLPHLAFSGRILLNEIPDLFRLIIDL